MSDQKCYGFLKERLRCDGESYDCLARFCVHGTTLATGNEVWSGTRSLIPGCPSRKRAAVQFAVSVPGDTGKCIWLQSWLTHIHIFQHDVVVA